MTTYPKKFVMSELLEMTSEELKELDDALYVDWQRVRNALEVKKAIEEEE
jgi:hypothetical protein